MRIQVLGLCRFSLLVDGDFQTTGADLDRNRAILFDPVRLDARMRWFQNVCLPPLLWQTDPDFTLILGTSEELPSPWMQQLVEIAEAIPQIRLMTAPAGNHARICKEMLGAATEAGADVMAQFRMDDDDAVARDYVSSVRRDYAAIAGLMDGKNPVAVDYAKGLRLMQDAQGALSVHCVLERLCVGALTLYFPGGAVRSVMNYRHDWMWRLTTTVSRIDRVMWLRGLHDRNDSPRHQDHPVPLWLPPGETERILSRRFGFDLGALGEALTPPEDHLMVRRRLPD